MRANSTLGPTDETGLTFSTEAFNGLLKKHGCLAETFTHGDEKHKLTFEAIAVVRAKSDAFATVPLTLRQWQSTLSMETIVRFQHPPPLEQASVPGNRTGVTSFSWKHDRRAERVNANECL